MCSNRGMYQESHLTKGKVALTNPRAAHPTNHPIAHPTLHPTTHLTLHPTAHPTSIPRGNHHLISQVVSPLINQVEVHPTSLGMMAVVVTLVVVRGAGVRIVIRVVVKGMIGTAELRLLTNLPVDLI